MADDRSTYVQQCLVRLQQGDAAAREELLQGACRRLTDLARTMLRGYRRLKRWEETDDVLQGALVRLDRMLREITPATPRDFYRLATTQIRRELIDLARRYFGPTGLGSNLEGQVQEGVTAEHPGARLIIREDGRHQEGMFRAQDLLGLRGWYSYTTFPWKSTIRRIATGGTFLPLFAITE